VREQAGDEDSFSTFVSASWTGLIRTAVLLTGDRVPAEDLVQTCLVRLFTRWSATQDPTAYVRTVMFREFFRHRRRYRNLNASANSDSPHGSSIDHSDQVAVAEVLGRALLSLPRRSESDRADLHAAAGRWADTPVGRAHQALRHAERTRTAISGCGPDTAPGKPNKPAL
jgi:DNA-directed RNA polymerase specialized sigma24 family protein